MKDSIYKLLQVNKNTSLAAYERLRKLKGFDCTVKIPTSEGSIFGLEDLTEYDESNTHRDKLLFFNLFQEASQGYDGYDSFIEAYALTTFKERLPLQTIVEVEFFGRTMAFKVDDHKNVSPSIHEQLFVKNILVAAT